MNNLGNLMKYEFKKLVINKVTIISLSACVVLLLGITIAGYLLGNTGDINVAKREASLEGRLLDDDLVKEISEVVIENGGFGNVPSESEYNHIAEYVAMTTGTYMSLDSVVGNYSLETLTSKEVYQARANIMHYLYDYFQLSDIEKEYWDKKEANIEKPFVWEANQGVKSMKSAFQTAVFLAVMAIGVCLSGIFASEKNYKTEDLILSSKEGKRTSILAKILTGELFALLIGLILLFSIQLPHIFFNGFHGFSTRCQLIMPFCSYTYTSGELVLICTGVYLLASLLIGALAMFLSCTLKNMIATVGIICVGAGVDLFVSFPTKYRFLTQIRFLTPIQILNNSSMADPRLLRLGNVFLSAYQQATILYIILLLLLCLGTFSKYSK